jgi:hypothetical protein
MFHDDAPVAGNAVLDFWSLLATNYEPIDRGIQQGCCTYLVLREVNFYLARCVVLPPLFLFCLAPNSTCAFTASG